MYGIEVHEKSGQSQYRQVYDQLRAHILSGGFAPGEKLASSRMLAVSLKVSRNVITEVIEQLKAEGYLMTRRGSGTFIEPGLVLNGDYPGSRHDSPDPQKQKNTEARGSLPLSFIGGIPSAGLFPRRAWGRCYRQALEYADAEDLGYAPGAGHRDLRTELSSYLYRMKGIRADADNILICSGAAQALSVIAQVFTGGKIILEDPLAPFVPGIFSRADMELSFADMDWEGLLPEHISGRYDLIYCAPSHQFPLGGTLSAARRLALLRTARECGSFIIEDDYDGEFRYSGRPVSPMQTLEPERVIFVGTFSKILSPALRMAYMVIPSVLLNDFLAVKGRMEFLNEGLQQAAMSRFISGGYLEKHVRRSVIHYGRRRQFILDYVSRLKSQGIELLNHHTGLHAVLRFSGRNFDSGFGSRAAGRGIGVKTVKDYCIRNGNYSDSLVIGYGQTGLEQLPEGLDMLVALAGGT